MNSLGSIPSIFDKLMFSRKLKSIKNIIYTFRLVNIYLSAAFFEWMRFFLLCSMVFVGLACLEEVLNWTKMTVYLDQVLGYFYLGTLG